MYQLRIILCSTRPGRKCPVFGNWIMEEARKYPEFQAELLDVAAINLPFMDEPHHPRLQMYQHQHTRDWSKAIAAADAFIFVTPEYNYSITAPFKNALDYLFHEWAHKAAGIVTYGGVSGGTRCAQMMKQVLTAVNIMPITESVNVPMFGQQISKNDELNVTDHMKSSSEIMFKALLKWTEALQPMRG